MALPILSRLGPGSATPRASRGPTRRGETASLRCAWRSVKGDGGGRDARAPRLRRGGCSPTKEKGKGMPDSTLEVVSLFELTPEQRARIEGVDPRIRLAVAPYAMRPDVVQPTRTLDDAE